MNMDLYNHGTLGVASDERFQPRKRWALRGLGSFVNHRSKNMAFFLRFETLQTLVTTEQS